MELHRDRERRGRALNVLGRMYRSGEGVERNFREALKCFREAAELYPKSPFLGLSVVNEATARAQQGDFEGALKTYRDFLASNPPPEVGAVAQLGIGNVFKEQGKWDEAIAAYKEVAAKFPQAAHRNNQIKHSHTLTIGNGLRVLRLTNHPNHVLRSTHES